MRHAWLIASLFLAAACGGEADDGSLVLDLWRQQVGEDEEAANQEMISRFEAANPGVRVRQQILPQGAYVQSVTAAALAAQLPCVLTVDAPMVPAFVWAEHVQPLSPLVRDGTFDDVAAAATSEFAGAVYAAGQFDAALAIYARRSVLEEIGARIPTIENPWTKDEFDRLLADLKATGRFAAPLDLATLDANPNWWTYAYTPFLQSFGGDLIDRDDLRTAEGTLNGPAGLAFAEWFRNLFVEGYVRRQEPDPHGLWRGTVALTWQGNWMAPEYSKRLGDDLLILPPPDLGEGPVIGGGSWQWAVSETCDEPELAGMFIEHLMQTEEIAAIAEAAGMIPVTEEAAAKTVRFRPDGDWRIFFDLMKAYAKERPATPAFTSLSTTWYRTARDVMDGKEPQDALDDAVDNIERVIEDNDGYRPGDAS